MQRSPGVYSMVTLPKSGWPVRGQMDVNSVAVSVTVRTSGAVNASAFRYSRASVGFAGRGSGPVRGSLGGCEVMVDSSTRHCTDVLERITFGKMTNPKPKAIALLSGGIRPTTAPAPSQHQGCAGYALPLPHGPRSAGGSGAGPPVAPPPPPARR